MWTPNRQYSTGQATVRMWGNDTYLVPEMSLDGYHSHQLFKELQANGFCKQETTA